MKRLYCVPGGGTKSILFIKWQKLLGEEIKVEYLDIPGRGYLSKKPEQESMRGIAEVMADVIEKKSADEPYLIFGYCFGAVAAYETCRVLKERGFHMPERLFVCGSYSPTPDKVCNSSLVALLIEIGPLTTLRELVSLLLLLFLLS